MNDSGYGCKFVYVIYDNGVEIDRGTNSELSVKYDVSLCAIPNAYNSKSLFKGKYTLGKEIRTLKYKVKWNEKVYEGTLEELMKLTGFTEWTIKKHTKRLKYTNFVNAKEKDKYEEVIDYIVRHTSLPPYYKTLLGGSKKEKEIEKIKNLLGDDYQITRKKDRDGFYWEITNVKLARRD